MPLDERSFVMGMVAYLTIDGIDGSCTVEGREKTVEVFAFNHSVSLPVDELEGKIQGNRRHAAIEIVKEFDKASPLLYDALCTGAVIKTCTLNWYRIDPTARNEQIYFTHKFENSLVVSIEPFMLNAQQYPDINHMERIRFRYEKITWIWVPDNIEKTDEWLKAR
jgi:type VI secretion system secreted protein Hcp